MVVCFARKNFCTFSQKVFIFLVPVKLREVHLKPNNVASNSEDGLSAANEEIVFYCFPMLDGIVDPHTVVVDVEWWVEDQLVIEESFNLKARSSGILQPQFWKMGQTVIRNIKHPKASILKSGRTIFKFAVSFLKL